MENELKPCPNCGGQAKLHKKGNKFYVECDGDCWTKTNKHSYPENAVTEWNRLERRNKEKTILPCPFCGKTVAEVDTVARLKELDSNHPDYNWATSYYSVVCNFLLGGCGAEAGGPAKSPEEAIEAWNRRCNDGT